MTLSKLIPIKWIVLISIFCQINSAKASLSIYQKIKKLILSSGFKQIEVGIWLRTLKGEKIFKLNDDKKFIPASLSKILTTAATLDNFPTNHKFLTILSTDGQIKNHVLHGSLYIQGFGNPSFVSEDMWKFVNDFKRLNINTINGDLILDSSYFSNSKFKREEQRVERAYDAPIGALSFNWNSINIYIKPSNQTNKPAIIALDPENEYTQIENHVVTVKKNERLKIKIKKIIKNNKEYIQVFGTIPKEHKEIVKYRKIHDPALWFGYNFKSFLKQRNIALKGNIKKCLKELSDIIVKYVPSRKNTI